MRWSFFTTHLVALTGRLVEEEMIKYTYKIAHFGT
ncbi:hypothetical protein QFZ31_001334 [Neobacillus niacini]|nr:hypothetical protein [Neobacillus niacini]